MTWQKDPLTDLPPSLRFYAGGDRSVRGYTYQSLGPKDASGNVIGGKHLLVGSVEVEYAISKSWSMALFYDVGNAFNNFEDLTWPRERGWDSILHPGRSDPGGSGPPDQCGQPGFPAPCGHRIRAVKKTLEISSSDGIVLVLIAAALVALGVWALNSPEGTRVLLKAISVFSPVRIDGREISGRLRDELKIRGLRVRWPQGELRADSFHLRWEAGEILNRRIIIREASLDGVQIKDDRPETGKISFRRMAGDSPMAIPAARTGGLFPGPENGLSAGPGRSDPRPSPLHRSLVGGGVPAGQTFQRSTVPWAGPKGRWKWILPIPA